MPQGGLSIFSEYHPGTPRKIADADYTMLPSDGTIIYTSITANRFSTLPPARTLLAGREILVVDQSGNASAINSIVIVAQGADTVNAGISKVIDVSYGIARLMSDGVSSWTVTG